MKHKMGRFAFRAICASSIYFLILLFVSNALVWTAGKRYKTVISGLVLPNSIKPGSFRILRAHFQWRKQFELLRGTIDVKLSLPQWNLSHLLVDLRGNQLNVKLGQSSQQENGKEILINRLNATVEIIPGQDPVIQSLSVDSSEIKIDMRGQVS